MKLNGSHWLEYLLLFILVLAALIMFGPRKEWVIHDTPIQPPPRNAYEKFFGAE